MKIFQFNFFIILLALVLVATLIFLPSYIIQNIWNSFGFFDIDRDLSIELWQAGLLWGACLSLIYMTGIFKFKIDFKTLDSIDIDSISDPELKAKIEKLKAKAKNEDDNSEDDFRI